MTTEVQNNNLVMPDIMGIALEDLKIQRRLAEKLKFKAIKEKITEINFKCYWCEHKIFGVYYVCLYHGKIFCEFCIKNFGQPNLKWIDAPKCDNIKGECVYTKIDPNKKDDRTI